MEYFDEKDLAKARKRVKAKMTFYRHLMTYTFVIAFLFLLNLMTSPSYWWFLFPALGWGLGLAFHYVDVFGIPGFNILTKEWEEEELIKELNRLKNEKNDERLELQPPSKLGVDELELKEKRLNYDESELV